MATVSDKLRGVAVMSVHIPWAIVEKGNPGLEEFFGANGLVCENFDEFETRNLTGDLGRIWEFVPGRIDLVMLGEKYFSASDLSYFWG